MSFKYYLASIKNDYPYMEAISENVGNAVLALESYHYVLVDESRNFKTCLPAKYMGTTPII
jgi:hypothetical protein